ncbi:hypothetical protein K4K58_010678 [Colletotrichum sp. SAR11_239]|nr:hypothetical protein K4K58_010678 [Colletotrichum sp. SAR11_239]
MGFISYGTFVERFSQSLMSVADILPIAEGNAGLYRTEQMKGAITQLYVQVIMFLREATEWYLAGTTQRILESVLTPYDIKFRGIEAEMKRCAQLINDIASMESNTELRAIKTIVKSESDQSQTRFNRHMEIQSLLEDGQRLQSAMLESLCYDVKGHSQELPIE